MSSAPTVDIPQIVRTSMGHAAVQVIATHAAVDVLHIKGVAADPTLRAPRGPSQDVDVLVRPSHLMQFLTALRGHGWQRLTSFERGSAFEHAAVWHHSTWGSMDVHRKWPGFTVNAEAAFDVLWKERQPKTIAAIDCWVPARPAQSLILLLHTARSHAARHPIERSYAYDRLPESERSQVDRLVERLGADVPFALVMGRFDEVRTHRSADLWWTAAHGGSRLQEWRARLKASPDLRSALRTAASGLAMDPDFVRLELGREPRLVDLLHFNLRRLGTLARGVSGRVRERR